MSMLQALSSIATLAFIFLCNCDSTKNKVSILPLAFIGETTHRANVTVQKRLALVIIKKIEKEKRSLSLVSMKEHEAELAKRLVASVCHKHTPAHTHSRQ